MSTPTFVQGDTLSIYQVPIVDANGVAQDLTGGTVLMFAKGEASGDRPATSATVGITASFVAAAAAVTVASTAGYSVGWRVIHAAAPQGAWIKSIDSGTQFTMSDKALSTAPSVSALLWKGIVADLSLAAQGKALFQGHPALCSLSALAAGVVQDIYDEEIYWRKSTGEVGISDKAQFIVRRAIS